MYYNILSVGVLFSAVILSENYFSYALRCVIVVFWALCLVLTFFNEKKERFIFAFLIVIFLLPFGPRDELALQSGELTSFVSIQSMQIAGFPLSILLILVFGIVRLLNSKQGLPFPLYLLFLFLLIVQVIFTLSLGKGVNVAKFFLSDYRNFVVVYFGLILGSAMKPLAVKQGLEKFLLYAPLIIAVKTLYMIGYDSFYERDYLSLGTVPYLFIPMFGYYLAIKEVPMRFLLLGCSFLGAISASRGNIIVFAFVAALAFIMFLRRGFSLVKIIALLTVSVIFISGIKVLGGFMGDSFLTLMSYKLDFFSSELLAGSSLNESTAIRLLEANRIIEDARANPIYWIIGKGMGGGFSLPANIKLTTAAFSQIQLDLNYFYRPHTFFNYFFLKGGLLMLMGYLSINFRVYRKALQVGKRPITFIAFFVLLCPFFYWIPEFLFLNGFFYGFLSKS